MKTIITLKREGIKAAFKEYFISSVLLINVSYNKFTLAEYRKLRKITKNITNNTNADIYVLTL